MAAGLVMIAMVAGLMQDAVAQVNCGGSFANSCSECPQGNGAAWCNGECAWVYTGLTGLSGQCMPAVSVGLPGEATQSTYDYLVGFPIAAIIMLIYACVYNQKVIKSPPGFPKVNATGTVARRGIFECFQYPDTCLYVTFCMPIVAAKNYYATDVCPFWPGCIFTFLTTYSPFAPVSMVVRALLSGRVQEKLGVKRECFFDCFYSMFCFPCDVGRESLEVDAEVGADIRCCCRVTYVLRAVADVTNAVEKTERACDRTCGKYRCCPEGN